NITTTDITNIKGVAVALAKIDPKAAPDILGVIISDLINRGVALNKTNTTVVGALKTALTFTGVNTANLTAVVNDIFDGTNGAVGSNPYGTFGTVTGAETNVHNG